MHSNKESVETKLQRIAKKASAGNNIKKIGCQFTSLFYFMNKELLLGCFMQLKGKAVSGIDKVSKATYAKYIDYNLDQLLSKLHKIAYRLQPVLRIYIRKAGSDEAHHKVVLFLRYLTIIISIIPLISGLINA